jgi:hypothetical protein
MREDERAATVQGGQLTATAVETSLFPKANVIFWPKVLGSTFNVISVSFPSSTMDPPSAIAHQQGEQDFQL